MPLITAERLEVAAAAILEAAGVEQPVARRVAGHLVGSELAGVASHGVMRIPSYVGWVRGDQIGRRDSTEVVRELPGFVLLDGHATFGPVVVDRAIELIAPRARELGIAAAAARNASHIGRLGEYAEDLARRGLVGFICCNSQGNGQLVAPWGGREPRLATNPLAWGVPTAGDPLIIDMSTSASAEGKIRVKHRRAERIPIGWAIDSTGHDTEDPGRFYGPPMGALLAAGGHKGFGLALVVEAIAGAMTGGGCVRPGLDIAGPFNAFVLLALDPAAVGDPAVFVEGITSMLGYVTSSQPRPGETVVIPGNPELANTRRALEEGIIIDDVTWLGLVDAAVAVGLDPARLGFA